MIYCVVTKVEMYQYNSIIKFLFSASYLSETYEQIRKYNYLSKQMILQINQKFSFEILELIIYTKY